MIALAIIILICVLIYLGLRHINKLVNKNIKILHDRIKLGEVGIFVRYYRMNGSSECGYVSGFSGNMVKISRYYQDSSHNFYDKTLLSNVYPERPL